MKAGFYQRLAWTGIRQNRQLYRPYLFTCAGAVMVSYIFSFLSYSPVLASVPGGGIITWTMWLGYQVMSLFALLFLYYTHSFLIRRRKKEFGLYNILGMGKLNLARVLVWEMAITALAALAGGLVCGIALSKLAELGLINLLRLTVDFTLRLDVPSVVRVVKLFAVIFLLLLAGDLWQIRMTSPVDLLRSENAGEKPPRANYLLALVGLVLLGVAYHLALSITDPVAALLIFFIAVILVILATDLLFVSGSVTLCRLLQKNKRFYYKTRHFVPVSSMAFRMKRNGESLSTICILCTMVLVMLSSTFCLYIGAEDALNETYPYQINLRVTNKENRPLTEQDLTPLRAITQQVLDRQGAAPTAGMEYKAAVLTGTLEGDTLDAYNTYVSGVTDIYLVPLADYARFSGRDIQLEPGEALVYPFRISYPYDSFTIPDAGTLRVKETLSSFPLNATAGTNISSSLFVVVPDWESYLAPLLPLKGVYDGPMLSFQYYCGFDTALSSDGQSALRDALAAELEAQAGVWQTNGFTRFTCSSRATERAGYYGTFGSLLFLGVLLSAVFLCAVVLIMYYKQLSEGYEDQSRFHILQNVGMTKQEIRQSINSQILLVFFLPLAAAGMHMCFAFPMLSRMLRTFGLNNTRLLALVTAACFLVFCLLYVAVYFVTSQTYYRIVSGADAG